MLSVLPVEVTRLKISGKKIASYRNARRMTQEEFAIAIGTSIGTVRRIERQSSVATHYKFLRGVAKFAGKTVEEIEIDFAADPSDKTDSLRKISIKASDDIFERSITAAAMAGQSLQDWIIAIIEAELDFKKSSKLRIAAHPISSHGKTKK